MYANQRENAHELLQGNFLAITPKKNIILPFHYGKDRTVPQESADCFKALLPLVAAQFLAHAHNSFLEGSEGEKSADKKEPEFSTGDGEATYLNNKNRLHKMAFKYAAIGYSYFAHNSRASSKFV